MRKAALLLIFLAGFTSGQLKRPPGSFENDRIAIESVVYADRESVKRAIGHDFDGAVAVVEIKVTPRGGEALDVEREDFTLFSNKDAQKAPAFHPSQLAGQGAIVVSEKWEGGGVGSRNSPNAPVIGGIPGTGSRGTQMPGAGQGVGNAGSTVTQNETKTITDAKVNPVLAVLKAKELPFGKTLTPVNGLLYFTLDGKHKLKDLELWYRGPAGKFVVTYKP